MRKLCALILVGILSLAGSEICATPAPAQPAATAAAPVAGPKNAQGLTAALIVNKNSYVLNAAQSGKDFHDMIAGLQKANSGEGGGLRARALPKPPAVDLTFRITNTTDAPVTISVGGDDSQMNLVLEGPGAITADNMVAMTMEFRIGTPVTIAPGQTKDVPISSLSFGMRGISKCAFWTEVGDYTITATLTYGDGEKQGAVTSGAAKVKVTKE